MRTIRVAELFAGIGGFRLGLERACRDAHHAKYEVVWSNQFEPTTKCQHASEIYVRWFGKAGHSNRDIAKVHANDIPAHDMLVGGFPCQDYSVARLKSQARGLAGDKGALWWEIHRILKHHRPMYLLLENVDRLLKSNRGRDFTTMLKSLGELGYIVEWRVVNAADYGMPQRRKRVFILGYKQYANYRTILPEAFPAEWINDEWELPLEKVDRFMDAGVLRPQGLWQADVMMPNWHGERRMLGDILLPDRTVSPDFYIADEDLPRWRYLKGAKREERIGRNGKPFPYSEGAMAFPDPLDKPARTIITGEGGASPSRCKHVVHTEHGYRRLTPIELERACMFPDDWTTGYRPAKRAFLLGNSLVVGVVERIADCLL